MNLLKKFFVNSNICGSNNKVYSCFDNKESKLLLKKQNSSITIKGNNNVVKFCWNIKKFPKGLYLTIIGDENYIEIHKSNFKNTYIFIKDGKNKFILKEQIERNVNNVSIDLERGGTIEIGKNCEIGNGNLHIVVNGDYKNKHKLVIGDYVHIAKDAIIRISDGQVLINPETGMPTDEPEDIIIGNNVWIMSRCIILKGSVISDGSAVAANSLVNKKFTEPNVLIAGTPAKVIKHNIKWARYSYGSYMEMLEKK